MNNQEHSQNNSADINQQITELLEEKPGLKAREIATHLDVDKKLVNSALYGHLKSKCVQDEKYCWYSIKNAPTESNDKKTVIPKTALSNLSRYYLACLGQDDEGGVSVFADSKYDLDYVELGSLPNSNSEQLFESTEAQKLFGKIRKDRGRLEMYFALSLIHI